jgi:hypothetical protein
MCFTTGGLGYVGITGTTLEGELVAGPGPTLAKVRSLRISSVRCFLLGAVSDFIRNKAVHVAVTLVRAQKLISRRD